MKKNRHETGRRQIYITPSILHKMSDDHILFSCWLIRILKDLLHRQQNKIKMVEKWQK